MPSTQHQQGTTFITPIVPNRRSLCLLFGQRRFRTIASAIQRWELQIFWKNVNQFVKKRDKTWKSFYNHGRIILVIYTWNHFCSQALRRINSAGKCWQPWTEKPFPKAQHKNQTTSRELSWRYTHLQFLRDSNRFQSPASQGNSLLPETITFLRMTVRSLPEVSYKLHHLQMYLLPELVQLQPLTKLGDIRNLPTTFFGNCFS